MINGAITVTTNNQSQVGSTATPAGPPGLSAYQVALQNGFVGTAAQWEASLIGPQGPPGPTGAAGPQGLAGPTGPQGNPTTVNGYVGTTITLAAADVGALAIVNNLFDLTNTSVARANLGLGAIATQAPSNVLITGGIINGTVIGGTAPAAGNFTTLSATTPLPTSSGGIGASALSGDGTLAAGVLTVTKTGGVAFAPSATADTTNASNISSGTLAAARMPSTTITGGAGLTGGGALTSSQIISVNRPVNAQTGTSYTVQASDQGKLITFNNTSAVAITVPQATGSFGSGFDFDILNLGIGTVTLTPATSTVNSAASVSLIMGQGAHWFSNGVNWFAQSGAGAGAVSSVATGAGLAGGPITSSGTITLLDNSMQGRLTLTSATPVLTTTVTATSILWTPYIGNLAPVWNGSAFVATIFSELSNVLANSSTGNAGPTAAAASQVYDLYVWSNGGTVTLTRGPAWSAGTSGSNTARGTGTGSTALTRVNGILVNANAITNGPAAGYGTYVGTIATDSSGGTVTFSLGGTATNATLGNIGLWNAHNRVPVMAFTADSTASWTYAGSSIRSAHGSNTYRINLVKGLPDDTNIICTYQSTVSISGGTAYVFVGLDSTTAQATNSTVGVSSYSSIQNLSASYIGPTGLGSHYLQALEQNASTTATYVGSTVSGLSCVTTF